MLPDIGYQFPSLNLHKVEFHSTDPRVPRREDETTEMLNVNNNYLLPFVIPSIEDNRDKKVNGDVIIVVNVYCSPLVRR
jgi:hypothetical protein